MKSPIFEAYCGDVVFQIDPPFLLLTSQIIYLCLYHFMHNNRFKIKKLQSPVALEVPRKIKVQLNNLKYKRSK